MNIRLHSLKAYHENYSSLYNKTEMARKLIRASKDRGLNAEELAEVTGWNLHANCSSALSRAFKQNDSIEYRPVEGARFGRYYCRKCC